MARLSLENPEYYLNRDTSWLAFNERVLEEAEDTGNPLLERLKFLAISASNLDEFFEIRVAAMMQQIEDGYNEAGPDGLTLTDKREVLARLTHKFVDEQYECWNTLRPALAENGIRVLGMHELDAEARRFVDEYCEKELDPLLTPVTVDPAHPFPRVINKALCLGLLLRRRRRSALTYTGVV
ncbi:MAG: RNA degradosome polyphosphate kinase, partial [Candidatus Sulfotelmatobacter sp.]